MKDLVYHCPNSGCGRVYTNKLNLTRHIQTLHRQNIIYKCSYCEKTLSSKQNLKEHQFTHTGQKPYLCPEPGCGLYFRQGSQLSAHKRIHTAIKKLNRNVNFRQLKVITNQLTDLLANDPAILRTESQFNQGQLVNSCEIHLPKITRRQQVKLPSLFDVQYNIYKQ